MSSEVFEALSLLEKERGIPVDFMLDKIKKEKRSLVMLERGVNGASFPVVQTDYAPALRACIEHLKQL